MEVTSELLIDAIVGFDIVKLQPELCDLLFEAKYGCVELKNVYSMSGGNTHLKGMSGRFIWDRSILNKEPIGFLYNLYDFIKSDGANTEAILHIRLKIIGYPKSIEIEDVFSILPVSRMDTEVGALEYGKQNHIKNKRTEYIREFVRNFPSVSQDYSLHYVDKNTTFQYLMEIPESKIIRHQKKYIKSSCIKITLDNIDRLFFSRDYI
jgi:hypothetical protein